MTSFAKRGFTLIELLIVVAIIAILAAIAVPNFLEAQVRSKVSRVKADMRTIATGLAAYLVDHNLYPEDQDNNPFNADERGFFRLTTPVAYLTSLARDPFSDDTRGSNPNAADVAAFYVMDSAANNRLNRERTNAYVITSLGPDRKDNITGDHEDFPFTGSYRSYDPTNGTISDGDIMRFGGDYRRGFWLLNGQSWRASNPPELLP
ncbi:prepilin-type N-terminal cleavage/methylation domain-containing protein [bacterium]|nr:prepilin-type N-terminal cleavage/methylation domain-containing protein [bacterium]